MEFISIFFGQAKKSFIFTLNQDLFFERMYLGKFDIPGIKDYIPLLYRDIEFYKLPKDDIKSKEILSKGNNFLIKLHGSCNWKSFDDSDTMVIGRGKKSKILKEPLLTGCLKTTLDYTFGLKYRNV
jgi:hypothetical protein